MSTITDEPRRIVVIGGGVAGLLAATRHASSSAQVTLIEAQAHMGGRVCSLELDGLVLDAGAESFATRGSSVADLLADLGLASDVASPTAAPAWVVGPSRAYPLPSTGWLGVPLDPWAPEVRRVLGWWGAFRAWSDRWRPLGRVAEDITVGQLVRSRVGNAVADRLVAPVIAGVYSRPIDEIPLAAIAPGLPHEVRDAGGLLAAASARRGSSPAGSAVQGLVGGMARLTEQLSARARSAGVEVVLNSPVIAVERNQLHWAVRTPKREFAADTVVIAVPIQVARAWLPELPLVPEKHVALVTLVVDAPELDAAPRGTGVLTTGNVTRAKALTHSTAKWTWLAAAAQGRHVLRLSYSIASVEEDVTSFACADASRLLGVDIDPTQVRATTQVVWPDAGPVNVDQSRLPDGIEVVGSAAGLSGLAAIVAAERAQP